MFPDVPDYAADLRKLVEGYSGPRARAVQFAPVIFQFYARLFADPRIGRNERALVNSVLAYFVVPTDVFPEESLGPVGLVDDLYLAAHVFRRLGRDLGPGIIEDAWHHDVDVEEVMSLVHVECRAEVGRRKKDVLRMAGLS